MEAVRGALDEASRVLEEHGGGETATLRRYADDPIRFVREVLGETDPGPWSAQVEIAEAVRDRPRVVVRSAHGMGKDWLGSRLLLWWVYARDGLAIVTAASERQLKNIVMREVRAAFRAAGDGLPGTLLTGELRLDDEARLLAFTGASVDTMVGYHDRAVLVVISEGQGERVEDMAYDAAFAVATSAESRILALGNPVRRQGRFYEINGAPNWHDVAIPARLHPNIATGERVIPNGPDRAWVAAIAEEYGEESDWYRSRVGAEFPRRDITTLVEDAWLDRAVALWRETDATDGWSGPATFGVDVARQGADASALAVYQGAGVRRVATWRGASTVVTADRVEAEAKPFDARPRVVVDVIGLGAGVHDTLRERGWGGRVDGFNAAQRAWDADRFANRRSEAAWRVRKALEAGQLALPDDPALLEEIAAHAWGVDPTGRVMLESKDDVRAKLRRSPDRFDAVAMAVWAGWRRRRLKGARLGSIPKTGGVGGERTGRIRIGFGDPGGDERAALDSQAAGSRSALPIDRENVSW